MVGTAKKRTSKTKRKKTEEKKVAAEAGVWKWILDERVHDLEFPTTDASTSPSNKSQTSTLHKSPEAESWTPPPLFHDRAPPGIELHCHTTCSDGLLSPEQLVERASRCGVNILAITDHDTFAGVPAAMAAAAADGRDMRIIPGVEISAWFTPRKESAKNVGESVHILGYFGGLGPAPGPGGPALHRALARVRAGRHTRARATVARLQALGVPLRWQHVEANLQPPGVAPTRPHIARALVDIGHVATEQEAFTRYLRDGGPAYVRGEELPADVAVRLVCQAGGIAVLAHPWHLTNALSVAHHLKAAGLHGMEVYRSGKKDNDYASIADSYALMKLGGSDFHGRQTAGEQDLGSIPLSPSVVHALVDLGRGIWSRGLGDLVAWLNSRKQDLKPGHADKEQQTTSFDSQENEHGSHEDSWDVIPGEVYYEDPFLQWSGMCLAASDGFGGHATRVGVDDRVGVGSTPLREGMRSSCGHGGDRCSSCLHGACSLECRMEYLPMEEWHVLHAEMAKVGLKYELVRRQTGRILNLRFGECQ